MLPVSHQQNGFATEQVFTMQGLRAFCGTLERYKRKYLQKTQLHRLTAKVGLIAIFAQKK
jgi:hypothetical protein